MTNLYNYFLQIPFFTLSKFLFTIWIVMMAIAVIIMIVTVIFRMVINHKGRKFFDGKSPDDERVIRFAMLVSMYNEVCRLILLHAIICLFGTVISFSVANFHIISGIALQIVFIFISFVTCYVGVTEECKFVRSAMYN